MEQNGLADTFKKNAIYRLNENTRMLEISLQEVTPELVWKKPNQSLNSIGNLVLHLCGNMRQYGISSLGNKPDTRQRDSEFTASGGLSKEALLKQLIQTVEEVKHTIRLATEEELLRERNVQGFTLSGIGIILHVVEHYSYHTGQIAFWVKWIQNKDLGFYQNIDLNQKNE
ncbi:MAG: DinB family protein [Flavobacteriaceae bacterium]